MFRFGWLVVGLFWVFFFVGFFFSWSWVEFAVLQKAAKLEFEELLILIV